MDGKFLSAMDAASSKIQNGLLSSGRDDMLDAFRECKDPFGKVMAAYNLGAAFWDNIGNGKEARKYYQLAVEEAEKIGVSDVHKVLPSIVTNTCENLMHLSLTYAEYFEWAEKLRKLDSTDDVLRGMVPHIQEAREKGIPWAHTLENFAEMCYNRNDPSQDRGEYARAVSTYHLILLNRKSMRVSREDWGRIVYEYGALSLRISADADERMKGSGQPINPKEVRFVVDDSKLHVDKYFSANPSDKNVEFLIENMNGFLHAAGKAETDQEVALLNEEGLELLNRQEYPMALAKFTEAVKICKDLNDQEKLQTCLGNMALVASETGNTQRALELTIEKENICRAHDLFSSLANALAIKATLLDSLHKTSEAIEVAEEASQLCVQYELAETHQKVKLLLPQLRSKLQPSLTTPDAYCSGCGIPMYLLAGKMVQREILMESKGCFQCGNCGRYTCYDCSDNREPCECGAKYWIEKGYLTHDFVGISPFRQAGNLNRPAYDVQPGILHEQERPLSSKGYGQPRMLKDIFIGAAFALAGFFLFTLATPLRIILSPDAAWSFRGNTYPYLATFFVFTMIVGIPGALGGVIVNRLGDSPRQRKFGFAGIAIGGAAHAADMLLSVLPSNWVGAILMLALPIIGATVGVVSAGQNGE